VIPFPVMSTAPREQLQSRLMNMAALFLLCYASILTISPSARLHTWETPFRWLHWSGYLVWLVGFSLLHRKMGRLLPDRDPYLLPIAALLSGWGLLTIWRLSGDFGWRQTLWLVVVLTTCNLLLSVPNILGWLRRYKYLWLTGGLLLMGLTFFFGTYPGGEGPHLWLGCCGVYLQPSEPLKLLLIVYLAAYLADRLPFSFSLLELLTPTLLMCGAAFLILLAQRDLGTATIILVLYAVTVYVASGRLRVLLISALSILASGLIGYQLFDVIRIRVNAWINPWLDPSGRSYQIVQSLIAVAAGGTFGRGPGLGSPGIVPVSHSDFIFAAIAEETGMLGGFAMLLLLALLALRGLHIALYATSNYQRYLAAGLTTYLASQSILIIAGNLRLLPLTGVTLPFVSYGGSSLLTVFLSLLLLTIISNQAEEEPAALTNPRPYLALGSALLLILLGTALAYGWWGYFNSQELQTRSDNPRLSINDRYTLRGALLDRHEQPLNSTAGRPGEYVRQNHYPPLSPVLGFTHPVYGQAGLEGSLDAYLRGLDGNPASTIWGYHLVYGQPPPGLDVRLSIDLRLQQLTDRLIGEHVGAAVLLNARTGEILVMASHPYFDPARLDEMHAEWLQDPRSPLLNRATQGVYPPGVAIGPFLLAQVSAQGQLPPLPEQTGVTFEGQQWDCAHPPRQPLDWGAAIGNGCPAALVELGTQLSETQIGDLYRKLGFYETPTLPLAQARAATPLNYTDPRLAILGQDQISITPLQMALAAAEISADGTRPAPRLTMAVNTPTQGWAILPNDANKTALPAAGLPTTTRLLSVTTPPSWQFTGLALSKQRRFTWFLAGTLPDWQGAPLALVVLLEEERPDLARQIGQSLLYAAQQP